MKAASQSPKEDFERKMASLKTETGYSKNLTPSNIKGLTALVGKIRKGWSAASSAYPDWSERPIEAGQCAVTALVVQDKFGGTLKRALVNGESHYWNEVNGETVDLTRAQFKSPLTIEAEIVRERDYLLGSPVTVQRYEALKASIG